MSTIEADQPKRVLVNEYNQFVAWHEAQIFLSLCARDLYDDSGVDPIIKSDAAYLAFSTKPFRSILCGNTTDEDLRSVNIVHKLEHCSENSGIPNDNLLVVPTSSKQLTSNQSK